MPGPGDMWDWENYDPDGTGLWSEYEKKEPPVIRFFKYGALALWALLRGRYDYDPATDEYISLTGKRRPAR